MFTSPKINKVVNLINIYWHLHAGDTVGTKTGNDPGSWRYIPVGETDTCKLKIFKMRGF